MPLLQSSLRGRLISVKMFLGAACVSSNFRFAPENDKDDKKRMAKLLGLIQQRQELEHRVRQLQESSRAEAIMTVRQSTY